MAITMAIFPALNANAQAAAAGTIAGASTTVVAVIAAVVVVGAVASADSESGRPDTFTPIATSTNVDISPPAPPAAPTSTTGT